ncbi:MAG: cytochrome C [Sulfurimonas sp.]|nr:cytochrome C [Sulfurimonas sp.]
MHSSFLKSKIFAAIALALLSYFFTFPMVMFHGVLNDIHKDNYVAEGKASAKVWEFYNEGRYKSNATPKEAHNNLQEMIDSGSEIGVASVPIWSVSLEAPNYPKEVFPMGIPVYFHFDGFSGEVHEMNTINHYIGMDPMWIGGQFERAIGMYALLALSLVFVYFIAYNKRIFSLLMLIPVAMPLIFLAEYAYWLYWFGHNLHNWGAFNIKPFMPTVFGDGKVAQFITHSYPATGFFVLLAIALFSLLAVMARKKAMDLSSDTQAS